MNLSLYLLPLLLFLLLIPSYTSLNSDGLALLALKSAITSDPFNTLSSWSELDTNPCNWSHILCLSNSIVQIHLPNKHLSGYLPSELGALVSLQHLTLSDNNFSGPIPTHLFNASNLTTLNLARNSLSGPIPTVIGSLKNLNLLDLSSNLLNGSLPSELSELDSLVGVLNLSYNGFSGEVPASFGSFPVMVSLDLRGNNLTGKIPQVGSLLNQGPTAFSGDHSNDIPPLSWASRLKIAQGIARGLMHIHECSPRKYIHGNFKSSKVLLDEDFHPYISGFGLTRLVSGSSKASTPMSRRPSLNQPILINSKFLAPSSMAYIAPEVQSSGGKLTQKSDVYSFGIVLMELLTGRVPDIGSHNDGPGLESLVRKVFREERPLSEIIDPALLHEVHAKKQVLATFHIALNCTEVDPELRPRMRSVSESLDGLKFE